MDDKLKILYISGHGRSGSTLLERTLGQVEGFVSVGELRHIWSKGFVANELCGCGNPFSECEFWHAVITDAFGSDISAQINHIQVIKQQVDRVRHIPKMVLPWQLKSYQLAMREYSQILVCLYRAIQHVSGQSVIVDASKDPSTAYVLAQIDELDLHVLHLIRDSRAVGFSWQRKRVRPDVVGQKQFMATYSPRSTAVEWSYRNLLAQTLKYFAPHYMRLRYEDFVMNPVEIVSRLGQFVALPTLDLQAIKGEIMHFDVNHTVAGNPFRFKTGPIQIRIDSEWREKMTTKDKRLITLWTLPLLRQYQYQLYYDAE